MTTENPYKVLLEYILSYCINFRGFYFRRSSSAVYKPKDEDPLHDTTQSVPSTLIVEYQQIFFLSMLSNLVNIMTTPKLTLHVIFIMIP